MPSREVEDVLAAHRGTERYIEPPRASAPRRWEIGHWALYKVATGRSVGYVKFSIVGESRCGFWFESLVVMGMYDDHTAFKVCLHDEPDLHVDLAKQGDLIRQFMSRRREQIIAKDFRDGQNGRARDNVSRMLEGFVILAWRGEAYPGRSEVIVPAGQFGGVVRMPARMYLDDELRAVMLWYHPDVPFGGTVKAEVFDEDDHVILEAELLDYGLTGARTELPDFDEYKRTFGLDEPPPRYIR